MKNSNQNKILVIIVTYNAMKWACKCFGSLRSSSIIPDIFVVDNGSSDGTQAYLQKNFPEIIFYQNKKNEGFGKANNIGLQYALENDYNFVYLLNQDAWIFPETLKKMTEISLKYPEYGILSPFQMNANRTRIDENFKKFTCESNSYIFNDIYNNQTKEIYPVTFVMAAHWLITKECLKLIGGFSPTFPHYREDNNYCDRLIYNGLKIGIVPSLRVVHDRENRTSNLQKEMYLDYTFYLYKLSNPNSSMYKQMLFVTIDFIKKAFLYKSISPFLYIIRIIFSLKIIYTNRITSKNKKCAFLNL